MHPETVTMTMYAAGGPDDPQLLVRMIPAEEEVSDAALVMMASSLIRDLGNRIGLDAAMECVQRNALDMGDLLIDNRDEEECEDGDYFNSGDYPPST